MTCYRLEVQRSSSPRMTLIGVWFFCIGLAENDNNLEYNRLFYSDCLQPKELFYDHYDNADSIGIHRRPA